MFQKRMQVKKPDRWTLIRDVAVLQVKLIVDGFRDLILVPLSIGAGVISLLQARDGPGTQFYDLLRVGRSSDRWINLFGAAERIYGPSSYSDIFPVDDIDQMVARVESFILEEYKSGGVTGEAKNRLAKALNVLRKRGRSDHP
jgi:hypothetical protein